MYQTSCVVVSKTSEHKLYNYCKNQCEGSKLLKNATLFRCRQLLFAYEKDYKNLLDHQIEVIEEFDKYTSNKYKKIGKDNYLPNSNQFQLMFEQTKNPDYYNPNLATQTSIHIVKKTLDSFKSFFKAIKDYYHNPSKYTGKPSLPKYIKTNETTAFYTNQDCVIYDINRTTYLKLPKMPESKGKKTRAKRHGYVNLGTIQINDLVQVEIQPYYVISMTNFIKLFK